MTSLVIWFLLLITPAAASPFESTQNLPVAYQGRFRSLESAARLWLYDNYHQQKIKSSDLQAFEVHDPSALNLLWQMHFHGHFPWDDAPFFWIHYATVKAQLRLDVTKDRFGFNTLNAALQKTTESTEDLTQLAQQLRLFEDNEGIDRKDPLLPLTEQMNRQGASPKQIAQNLEIRFPLHSRLQAAGVTLKMLPSRFSDGEWFSLHAFKIKVYDPEQRSFVPAGNFTAFSDQHFFHLRSAYLDLERAVMKQAQIPAAAQRFADAYFSAYATVVDRPYKQAAGKSLSYPSELKLKAETLYYQLPLMEATLVFYAAALLLMLLKQRMRYVAIPLALGFILHTTILALRCYILQRPPVSNMFETVVYVPWIALIVGLLFYAFSRIRMILISSLFGSLTLLALLMLTQINARMENVQAVLDSQYWLIIHVLMVVGSYGAFVVCGVLGHLFLLQQRNREATAKGILHTMYVGVALLIPGTILGGVWAAESWGRFWDWDPKESWAFISACIYLIVIHAYTFHRIADFGLAVGAICGLMAISFTWYGVNYVLGTGLHSYGFGSGGESAYFLYLAAEIGFLLWAAYTRNSLKKIENFRYIQGDITKSVKQKTGVK